MNIRVFCFMFFYLIFSLKTDILCMNPNANRNKNCQQEDNSLESEQDVSKRLLIQAYLKQFFLEVCGENVNLDSKPTKKLNYSDPKKQCSWCENDLSIFNKIFNIQKEPDILSKKDFNSSDKDIADVLRAKVCQSCAAARAVKLLLLGDYLIQKLEEAGADNMVFCFPKDIMVKAAKERKRAMIKSLVCSYELQERFNSDGDKEEIEKICATIE